MNTAAEVEYRVFPVTYSSGKNNFFKKPVDKIFVIGLLFGQIYGKVCSGVLEGGNLERLEHLQNAWILVFKLACGHGRRLREFERREERRS